MTDLKINTQPVIKTDPNAGPALVRVTKTNRELVYQCLVDLNEHNKMASRQRISQITGLKLSIVDDHIDRLKNEGLVHSLYAGVFEPVDQTPDRNISTTSLSQGRLKIEIGDDVCTNLTPREQLSLAKQLAGVLLAFGSVR